MTLRIILLCQATSMVDLEVWNQTSQKILNHKSWIKTDRQKYSILTHTQYSCKSSYLSTSCIHFYYFYIHLLNFHCMYEPFVLFTTRQKAHMVIFSAVTFLVRRKPYLRLPFWGAVSASKHINLTMTELLQDFKYLRIYVFHWIFFLGFHEHGETQMSVCARLYQNQ